MRGILYGRGLSARYSGHAGVTGSLARGLRELQVDYRLNPMRIPPGSSLGILAGTQALQWAVNNPQISGSSRLVVGPNVNVLASEDPANYLNDRVGRILVPSDWVRDLWAADMPEISGKSLAWACGVDFDYWHPRSQIARNGVPLIYPKIAWPGLHFDVARTLSLSGIPFRSVTYGSYFSQRFRPLLQESSCVTCLADSESQGLAMLEWWAMDVPTFVFDAPHKKLGFRMGEL